MRRTHSTLMGELGIDGKLVADQCGHTLDVSQSIYRQSPVASRLPAVNQLEISLNGVQTEFKVPEGAVIH
jgi:integrase